MRRFLTLEDLKNDIEWPTWSNIFDNFGHLLIAPEFEVFDIDMRRGDITNIPPDRNSGLFFTGLYNSETPESLTLGFLLLLLRGKITNDGHHPYGEPIAKFYSLRDTILNNLRAKMERTLSDDILVQLGLSPQQFIIKIHDIKIADLGVYTYVDGIGAPDVFIGPGIDTTITVILSIEDISGFEPGEDQALRIQYNNLCSNYTVQSEAELRNWAVQLQIPGAIGMNKLALCQSIVDYYGWA